MAKIVCVLYPDPVSGYPEGYRVKRSHGDATPGARRYLPPLHRLRPGELLGASPESWVYAIISTGRSHLHRYLDKTGRFTSIGTGEAEIVISQPFCRPT